MPVGGGEGLFVGGWWNLDIFKYIPILFCCHEGQVWFQETHGKEKRFASPRAAVRVLGADDAASVVEIEDVDGQMWHVLVNNGAPSDGTHTATFGGTTHTWTGNAAVRPVR